MTDRIEQSDRLHERVQAFMALGQASADDFERLALAIAAHQAATIPAFARLVRARQSRLDCLESIPSVHVDAFRMTRIAAHPPERDTVQFFTSGTTSAERGQHCMRRTDTYRLAAIQWGRRALLPRDAAGATVIAIAPRYDAQSHSSLGFMMQAFLEAFDTRGHAERPSRWLLSDDGVDVEGLRRVLQVAARKTQPVLVLATSFALVFLLDALAGATLPSNGQTTVMQTGGFKGKSRQVAPDELRTSVARAFGIDAARVVGEYGMTELTSQLYEGTLPDGELVGETDWFMPPPWLRVDAVDPIRFEPLPEGQEGLARFTDLGNVDSAIRVLTEDRIRCRGGNVQLLGRAVQAPERGCSLGDEALVRAE